MILDRWRSTGIFVITILGFLLHYVYSWSGSSKIIGLFVPVNESVWEHLKLGYWSVALFSCVEYLQLKKRTNNYFFARITGVITLEATIILVFYSYTFIAGKNILAIDILTYILAVILCQYLTYIILRSRPLSRLINRISLLILILPGILFGIMTYYPPHVALFQDPVHKTYGINNEK